MPHRSQRHKFEIQGGGISLGITAINPTSASIVAAGAVGRAIATMSATGGTPPYTWSLTNAAGLAMAFTGNVLQTTADPVGTAGTKTATVMATDNLGQTRSQTLTVTVTASAPAPTITITSLSPNTAVRNTSLTVGILGSNLQPGDIAVWDTGSVATNYIWSGQVTTETVATGPTAKTVQVHLLRPSTNAVSNNLPFTVT